MNSSEEVGQLLEVITRIQTQWRESEEQAATSRRQNSELYDRALTKGRGSDEW